LEQKKNSSVYNGIEAELQFGRKQIHRLRIESRRKVNHSILMNQIERWSCLDCERNWLASLGGNAI
jgi:hypothetical protein